VPARSTSALPVSVGPARLHGIDRLGRGVELEQRQRHAELVGEGLCEVDRDTSGLAIGSAAGEDRIAEVDRCAQRAGRRQQR